MIDSPISDFANARRISRRLSRIFRSGGSGFRQIPVIGGSQPRESDAPTRQGRCHRAAACRIPERQAKGGWTARISTRSFGEACRARRHYPAEVPAIVATVSATRMSAPGFLMIPSTFDERCTVWRTLATRQRGASLSLASHRESSCECLSGEFSNVRLDPGSRRHEIRNRQCRQWRRCR